MIVMQWAKYWRQVLPHAALCGTVLLLIVAGTLVYVGQEHTFYETDYIGYQNIAHGVVAQFERSPRAGLNAIIQSTGAEYNALFTVPLVPFMLLFGESRSAFEAALAVVYLFPFTLMLGALAVELIRARPAAVFWSTVFLALLTPMLWVPTLRGYPDTGAATLMMFALWVYLRDTRLARPWQVLLIGFLTASAVLYRRPFGFAAVAFFAAIVMNTGLRWAIDVRKSRSAGRDALLTAARIALTGLVALLVLLLLGRQFLMRFLTTNYGAQLAGYDQPPLFLLAWYISAYGGLAAGAAVLGYVAGVKSRVVRSGPAVFIGLFVGLTGLAWLFLGRQINEPYTLNFTPFVVLGGSALLWTVAQRYSAVTRRIAFAGAAALLGTNMVLGLTAFAMPAGWPLGSLFALAEPPFTRGDQAEVGRLVAYLRGVAGNGEPIYVVAASSLMNRDVMQTAERDLYGWEGAKLNLLRTPTIDSQDEFPLQLLLQSQVVLVVDPLQVHLGVENQRLVQVVYDMFREGRDLAQDFEILPGRFTLDQGAEVTVYRRVRPSSFREAIQTLELMRRYLPKNPGGQLDWIGLDPVNPVMIRIDRDKTFTVSGDLPGRGGIPASSLLYLGAIPGKGALAGQIEFSDANCSGVTLRLASVTADGNVSPIGALTRRAEDPPDFSMPFAHINAPYLLLTLEGEGQQTPAEGCSLSIDHLRFMLQ